LFALASSPGEPFELLVKDAPGAAAFLLRAPLDRALSVSQAMGPGFRFDDVEADAPVLLCATGSGIAPVRPLLRALMRKRARPMLLYGGTHVDALGFLDELMALEAERKTRVRLFVSRGDAGAHETKRLLDAIQPAAFDYARITAFLCGVRAMIVEVTDRLRALGVPADRIRVNY